MGLTQEGLLSQNMVLFQRLMLMVTAWSAGATTAQHAAQAAHTAAAAAEAARLAAARAARPDVEAAAAAAMVARRRAMQPPTRPPRRPPAYVWDSSLQADCDRLKPPSQHATRDQLRAIADANQRQLATGAFAFGASTTHSLPSQPLAASPSRLTP